MRQLTPFNLQAGQGSALRSTLIYLLLLLLSVSAAQGSGGPSFRYGAVYTRGLVLGPGEQMTTAGRFLMACRLVNGKLTSTTSPKS